MTDRNIPFRALCAERRPTRAITPLDLDYNINNPGARPPSTLLPSQLLAPIIPSLMHSTPLNWRPCSERTFTVSNPPLDIVEVNKAIGSLRLYSYYQYVGLNDIGVVSYFQGFRYNVQGMLL